MKWFRFAGAVIATLGLTTAANAGLLDLFGNHGSSKSCGCAPCSQPQCCKPTITMPCCPTVHTYQRKISDKKPPCCDTCCAPKSCCAPVAKCCAPAPTKCCAPVAAKCCAPVAAKCAAPAAAGCCAPKTSCCNTGCCQKTKCCNADPCEIAKLIYKSQTACYAKDRRSAIHELGDKFDCQCNPEIMVAFVYALNDADEEVRAEAADEIGDQLKQHPCCCSKEVTAALTCALADCDRDVRKQAEEALEACGYCIVDGCCCESSCCNSGCDTCGQGMAPTTAPNAAPTPAPAPNGAAPSPAPPEDPKAYFPSRLRQQQTKNNSKSPNRLANLFGLID